MPKTLAQVSARWRDAAAGINRVMEAGAGGSLAPAWLNQCADELDAWIRERLAELDAADEVYQSGMNLSEKAIRKMLGEADGE